MNPSETFADLDRLLPSVDVRVVFDVGAHAGGTAVAIRKLKPEARIWAFEPVAASFAELTAAIDGDELSTAVPTALGAAAHEGAMLTDGTSPNNRVVPVTDPRPVEAVSVTTGDDFCAGASIDAVDYLALDVVGHELEVLRGFLGMLGRAAIDVIEVTAGLSWEGQKFVPLDRLVAFLEPLGYELVRLYQPPSGRRGSRRLRSVAALFASSRVMAANVGEIVAAGATTDAAALPVGKVSFLQRSGWVDSHASRRPVDADGHPLPWYTYAAIAFLEPRVTSELDVFEFGSGFSTLWWAARAGTVSSVEHNPEWAAIMADRVPDNVTYRTVTLRANGDYCRAAAASGKRYDVIVIDGRDRVNCARQTLGALKEGGVVIWDNSDRDKYAAGYQHLVDNGFKRLDFHGMGPVMARGWETAIFYRDGNCLGI
jgi:FkbM family methyltransferase